MSDFPIESISAPSNRRAHFRRGIDAERDLLARLVNHIPAALLCFDRDWVITYANEEACRISRIQPEHIGHKTHWELFPETCGTVLERVYRGVMESRIPQELEYFHEPFDVWVHLHAIPMEPGGIALYYRDITPQKNAEAQRDIANSRLQQLSEASGDSILCMDRNWVCTFANHAAHEILKSECLVGENLWQHLPFDQQETFRSHCVACMERRIPSEFEAYYPHPLDIWFKVLVRPFEDGIVLFATDITDRKGAELLRDTSARRLHQVLETTTDAVLSLSHDWNYTYLNHRAKELLAPRGDLLGKNIWEEFPATAQSPQIRFHFRRAMEQGIASEFEVFYPEPLNLWLSIQCRPYDDGIVVFFRDISTRRASETMLKQQHDLLAAVQQTARVATWDIDYATGKVTFGAGSYPVFGHPLEEIPDFHAFKKILVPSYLSVIEGCIQSTVTTGKMIVQEFQVIAADGRTLWLESRGQAVFVEGRPSRIRGMTLDIGEHKRSQEALVASEARYRVLADLNPQAIWMGDARGAITYANQNLLDYIGLSFEEVAEKGLIHSLHPEDHAQVLEAWSQSFHTGIDFNIEARLIRAADGQSRWWWLRAQPVRDDSGKILNWLGVAIDIHDSKTFAETLQQRQQETERQRAELETVYQTAPIGLALFDPVEFRYLRLNEHQAEIVGLPYDQVLGRTLTEIAPIEGLREMFEQVAAGHPIRNQLLEGELPTRPGEHRFWNVNYFPVYGSDGSIQAITAASLEITAQKKAETALIQSEKLAAVGRLASSISHEINNPLEAITNLLYLINLSDDLPQGVRTFVNTAQAELSRVCQIATQTLRFHRQAVRATRVSAADLVDAVLNLYQGRLANSNIRVQACYSTSATVLCFENDIRQVLNNLIANAIDAMRQGGRLIVRAHNATLRSAAHPQRRSGIRITIADTGHGMSAAVQSRLFEPFYTTKDLNGTGLGLWISAGIVTRHQGRLTFRSSDHPSRHGTVFSLFIPQDEIPQSEAPEGEP